MIVFPNCKINLGLNVLRKRSDGYHDIRTVMVPVRGLTDVLEIVRAGAGVEYISSGLEVDCPEAENLCLRAYRLLQEKFGIGGVRIHLHKKIPFGAGLGGGSADAAFTISSLDSLFGLKLHTREMEELAGRLGSDTAFFIRNSISISEGRGELLTPFRIPNLSGKMLLLVKPPFGIPTAGAYSGIVPKEPRFHLEKILSDPVETWKGRLVNDFESTVFGRHPSLAEIKEALYDSGALYASMSGSGSALYGIFPGTFNEETISAINRSLSGRFPGLLFHSEIYM